MRATVRRNSSCMPAMPASPKNSAHSDQPNAASVPTETRVSMVAAPCRALVNAALWNGSPPQTTTGAARVSASHCQLSNCRAGTIESSTTGRARRAETVNRSRREASSGSSSLGVSGSGSGGAGSSAVYPVLTTVAMRSATWMPAG